RAADQSRAARRLVLRDRRDALAAQAGARRVAPRESRRGRDALRSARGRRDRRARRHLLLVDREPSLARRDGALGASDLLRALAPLLDRASTLGRVARRAAAVRVGG